MADGGQDVWSIATNGEETAAVSLRCDVAQTVGGGEEELCLSALRNHKRTTKSRDAA